MSSPSVMTAVVPYLRKGAEAISASEVVGNFHVHTIYSDGTGTHLQVAQAAAQAGLDVVTFTDHNLLPDHHTGWYICPSTGRRVLLLMGQEVHDQARSPSVNHYLCLGVDQDVHTHAARPQRLITACRQHGGAGFIAHPIEHPVPIFPQILAFPWVDWDVTGYTGIEVWNHGSEFKSVLANIPIAIVASFLPDLFISGPFPETLARWDRLTSTGRRVVAIGNADAHANVYKIGPIHRHVFDYAYLFKTVNTHLLLEAPLAADWALASQQVMGALKAGRAFVAYNRLGSARGFRFVAVGPRACAGMGDEVHLEDGLTLHARVPQPAAIHLLKDGREVGRTRGRQMKYPVHEPGVFRVEVRRAYGSRGLMGINKPPVWILSNPIYVRV